MPESNDMFASAGIDFSKVVINIDKLFRNFKLLNALRLLIALTVLNNLSKRKIFVSNPRLLARTTGRTTVMIEIMTMKKS